MPPGVPNDPESQDGDSLTPPPTSTAALIPAEIENYFILNDDTNLIDCNDDLLTVNLKRETIHSQLYAVRAGSGPKPVRCGQELRKVACLVNYDINTMVWRCSQERDHYPCIQMWANKQAIKAKARLDYAKDFYNLKHNPQHYSTSFKKDQTGQPMTVQRYETIANESWSEMQRWGGRAKYVDRKVKEALEEALDCGLTAKETKVFVKEERIKARAYAEKHYHEAALAVTHGWRKVRNEEGKIVRGDDGEPIWLPAPHVHLLTWGYFDLTNMPKGGEVVIKNLSLEDKKQKRSLFKTISYLLDHCALVPKHHALKYFGDLSYRKIPAKVVPDEEKKDRICPTCGESSKFVFIDNIPEELVPLWLHNAKFRARETLEFAEPGRWRFRMRGDPGWIPRIQRAHVHQ